MTNLPSVSAANIEAHLRKLTVDIGVRLAGSDADRAAAAYIGREFERNGAQVSFEEFAMLERRVTRERLDIRLGESWHSFPCSLFSSTPGTDGKTLEAPVCFFEAATEYARADLSHLRGKAVVHLGCHIESRENYRRLMAAQPAFMLFVDVRYPGTAPLADGMFPAYTHALGAVPTVNVAYMDAWRWKTEGALAARLLVEGGMRASCSQNVVAELPGQGEELVFAGAHHDTQAGSVGADDNGCGVAAILELSRVLAPQPRQRGIRLISFGAEEQLSVGSAEYVRSHRAFVSEQGRFMFNFDSFGSHLGWTELNCSGVPAIRDQLVAAFQDADIYVEATDDVVPYTDLFPFSAAGVPGVYLGRHNCTAGRFFHHRSDDDMTRVSPQLIAAHTDAAATFIAALANAEHLPFSAEIPREQRSQIELFWEDLYGGWQPLNPGRPQTDR